MREILISFVAIAVMPVIPRIRARMQGDCVARPGGLGRFSDAHPHLTVWATFCRPALRD